MAGTIHNSLLSKSKLPHLKLRSAQYKIHDCAEFRFCQIRIGIFYPTPGKVFSHAFRNRPVLVYRLYSPAFYDLKIQSFPLAVISSLVYGVCPAAFCPVANASLQRRPEIEEWAKDVYSFMAKRFGENNIISFYVHLDEKNPHCHCTLVPVDPIKNRISWKSVFGDGREAESANMTKLHSELQEAVSEKWGLERGSNMEETRARHRSTEEYKRELVSEVCNLQSTREDLLKQIHRAEIKLKGISTMIANLQARKDDIQTQIDQIAQQLGQSGADNDELANKIALLRKEMEGIDEKLAVRYKMLDDANDTINEAKARLAEMKEEHREMLKSLGEDNDLKATAIQKNILWTYNKMLTNSIEPLIPSLSDCQQEILDESGYNDLTTNTDNVINCAMLLVLGYIREATTYAQSCGGGSSPGTGWGRDKDEDDEHWWRRCIAQSAAMMRPATHKRKRGR